jgi:hypothetical protein
MGEKSLKKVLEFYPDIYSRKDLTAEELSSNCKIPHTLAESIIEFIKTV